jgi:hypothetical protein
LKSHRLLISPRTGGNFNESRQAPGNPKYCHTPAWSRRPEGGAPCPARVVERCGPPRPRAQPGGLFRNSTTPAVIIGTCRAHGNRLPRVSRRAQVPSGRNCRDVPGAGPRLQTVAAPEHSLRSGGAASPASRPTPSNGRRSPAEPQAARDARARLVHRRKPPPPGASLIRARAEGKHAPAHGAGT